MKKLGVGKFLKGKWPQVIMKSCASDRDCEYVMREEKFDAA